MDLDALWTIADRARTTQRLTSDEVAFVRETVPRTLKAFPRMKLPKTARHPAGFTVAGAPVGTFLRSALLLAGRKALGARFAGSEFYETVERDLALGIMRSHFHHGYPKGTHCCVQCTLAVVPVLDAGAIRYFDCAPLARDVRRLIADGGWRFTRPPNARMVAWALHGAPTGSRPAGARRSA